MKYIPADKLIAEIERRMSENCKLGKKADCFSHRAVEDNDILALIESLQQEQPEMDIEKEIDEHAINMPHSEFTHDSECVEHEEWAKREFRHFYELGLNARKEE